MIYVVWGFGDPHITTLDGLSYTFNGIGEYVLVRSMDDDIEFQGRTNVVGNANATAFSVLAIRHNGTTVQVNCLSVQFCIHKMKTSDTVNREMFEVK